MLVRANAVFFVLAAALTACSGRAGHQPEPPVVGFDSRDAGRDGSGDVGGDARPDTAPIVLPVGCEPEQCGNGLDDDCDDSVEEGCFCLPIETASCFRGRAEQRGVGACRDGTMTCSAGLEFGTWGPCEGDVAPALREVCDGAGLDEDCNGAIDDGCACNDGEMRSCGDDTGECRPGTQRCEGGMLTTCEGATGPVAEGCNNLDDDCDGNVDEGITRPCGTGTCMDGTQRCVAGGWDECTGATAATDESCDGADNDCDGNVDETLIRACGSSTGSCRPGTQSCTTGTWSICSGETMPALESCNDADDDCDGNVDEGVTRACGSSTGICRPGTETCSAGSFGTCIGGTTPGAETCDGSLDENCNGTVDEGCTCAVGTTMPCGTATGACNPGSQTCNSSGAWGACMGAIGPTPEVCNGVDDDCNGTVDDPGTCPTAPPSVMCGAAITRQVLSTVTLSGSGADPDGGTTTFRWRVVSRPTGSTSVPVDPSRATTTFFLDAAGSYTLELCATDDEGEQTCCRVAVTSTAPPGLHFEVQWSTAYGDVDVHLLSAAVAPDNGWFTTQDCYFRNTAPDWGTAGAPGNPTLDRDDVDGYGPENITITNAPTSGTYDVGVHYFCDRSAAGRGSTEATVRVYCDDAIIATYSGITLSETDDWVTVAAVDYPSCVGRSVNRRTNGTQLLPSTVTVPYHCEIPCTSNADCPSGERCASVRAGGPPRIICWLD